MLARSRLGDLRSVVGPRHGQRELNVVQFASRRSRKASACPTHVDGHGHFVANTRADFFQVPNQLLSHSASLYLADTTHLFKSFPVPRRATTPVYWLGDSIGQGEPFPCFLPVADQINDCPVVFPLRQVTDRHFGNLVHLEAMRYKNRSSDLADREPTQ